MAEYRSVKEMTDAEFIRALKHEDVPASCKEIHEYNNRLEKIACILERIENETG